MTMHRPNSFHRPPENRPERYRTQATMRLMATRRTPEEAAQAMGRKISPLDRLLAATRLPRRPA
jgi:hypothetical protein